MPETVLKALTQGAYDLQKVRIQMGNRLCQAYYQAHGVDPGEKPEDVMSDEDQEILDQIRTDYRRLTDGLVRLPHRATFVPTKYLSSFPLLVLAKSWIETEKAEYTAFRAVEVEVETWPIWDHWLKDVRGCGTGMAAVMLSKFDIHKAERPSQFWAYAGLDVADDGRRRSRRKEHLVERTYINREGEEATRLGITFEPWIKTKMFVLATCFMRSGSPYAQIYYDRRKRMDHMPPPDQQEPNASRPIVSTVDWSEATKQHKQRDAQGYMIKEFLADFWRAWRLLEGLPVVPRYGEAKLGLPPHRQRAA